MILLLEALCSRVPCGHRFARTRDSPAWPAGIWSCHACNNPGLETAGHILLCPATDGVRRDAVRALLTELVPTQIVGCESPEEDVLSASWVNDIRVTFSLTRQVDTTPGVRDHRFREWCSRDRRDRQGCESGWAGSWAGQFMLITPTSMRAPAALRKATSDVTTHRPTRVVLVLPSEMVTHWALASAQWVGNTGGAIIALVQNNLAEVVSPCRGRIRELSQSLGILDETWNVDGRAWPTPPLSAWSLSQGHSTRGGNLSGWRRYLDVGRTGGVRPAMAAFLKPQARRAMASLNQLSDYTRRLGVIPAGYGMVVQDVLRKATGEDPPLKAVSAALSRLRSAAWDSACMTFRAAHASRIWLYNNDPDDRVLQVEEDVYAQRMFEHRRERASGRARKGARPTGARHSINLRNSRQRRLEAPRGQAVASSHTTASRPPPVRRSQRVRRPRPPDGFFWNFNDDYVEALDEISARGSAQAVAQAADRRGRARRPLMALI
jgi:hypothetical protein